MKGNRIFILVLMIMAATAVMLPRCCLAAVAVPRPRARRYMDDPSKLPKAPPKMSEEQKKLMKQFGPRAKPPENPKFKAPTPTARPKPMASPKPTPTPKAKPVKKANNSCFVAIIVFLIVVIAGILSAPGLIKKIMEHRRHNF